MGKIIKDTKKNLALKVLMTGEHLSALTAHQYIGTLHLSQIISKLKQEGYPIETDMKQDLNGMQYASYHIPKGKLKGTWKQMSLGF